MSRKLITAVAAATLGAVALSTPAQAEVGATVGWVSDYVYRGVALGESSANVSIDYSNDSGFSAGVWAIDDATAGTGLEYDIYLSYGQETDSFSWSVGYTRYEYTYATNFEHELNLGLGMGSFGLAVDIGQADANVSGVDAVDYRHVALSYALNDIYSLTVGNVDPDTDADDDAWTYLEVSAAGEISGLDVALTLGTVEEDDFAGKMSGYLTLSVSKSFDSLGF